MTENLAGRRVIEDTIREELPEDFQRAERMLDHGLIDMVVERRDLRETLIRVISLLRQKTPAELAPKMADPEVVAAVEPEPKPDAANGA